LILDDRLYSRWTVLLDYIFGVAVAKQWGFKAEPLYDPNRGPTIRPPAQVLGQEPKPSSAGQHERVAAKREAASRQEIRDGDSSSSGHGMSLEQAEAMMEFIAARSPTARAAAKARREKEDAKYASIASWAHTIGIVGHVSVYHVFVRSSLIRPHRSG
jgi:hypothetical protein